jgi:uncharacterized repeat protein (TIGR03899 family)
VKKNQSDVLVVDSDVSDENVIEEQKINDSNKSELVETQENKPPESPSSQLFLKLAKQFVIDGALLATDKQMPIEDRANKRNRLSHLRKQQNIENVIQKTLTYCANNDIKARTDHDWFNRYIGLAEDVSNTTMQDLWAKILAGELAKPGAFSYKALKIFRDMSIIDAKLLAKACSLAIKDTSQKNIRLVSGVYQQPGLFNFFAKDRQLQVNLSHFGLNYADLLTLAENHLIYIQQSELSVLNKDEKLNFFYNGSSLKLTAKKDKVSLQFYKFTPLGSELANLISDKANEEFFTYLKKQLSSHFSISSN